MSFDNLCKLLSEKYPANFANWILGTPQTTVQVLKTELSIEPIRADSVTFLQLQERLFYTWNFKPNWNQRRPYLYGCWITGCDCIAYIVYQLPRLLSYYFSPARNSHRNILSH
nr:hypothetical protein [Pleurocapsa sp. PCC 7327]